MTTYTAFVALGDDGGDNGGGVWEATDFLVTGAQPTWAKKVSGLPNTDILCFQKDPFHPTVKQYLALNNAGVTEIYRRDTSVADGWVKILDAGEAYTLVGQGASSFDGMPQWVWADTQVEGRLHCLWSDYSFFSHYCFLLRSDDWGATWTAIRAGKWARGCGSVVSHGAHVWIGINRALFGGMAVAYSNTAGSAFGMTTVINSSSGYLQVMTSPARADYAYVLRFSTSAGGRDLIEINGNGGSPVWSVLQDSLNLGSSWGLHGAGTLNSDNLWIDPDDGLHQHIQAGGAIYVTHDGWGTVDDATPDALTGVSAGSHAIPLVSPSYDPTPVLFLVDDDTNGVIFSLSGETDASAENRSGTNWDTAPYTDSIPQWNGYTAFFGLAIVRELVREVLVYATEMDDVGTKYGIPVGGDRSAWDILNFPARHANDSEAGDSHHPELHALQHLPDGSDPLDTSAFSTWKAPMRAATTAALPANTLSSGVLTADTNGVLPDIDGVTLVVDDRLLVKDEVLTKKNGIYVVGDVGVDDPDGSPYILVRAEDANSDALVVPNIIVSVSEGTAAPGNADSVWTLTTDAPITLDTTGLTFTRSSSTTLHSLLTDVSANQHHTQSHDHSAAGDGQSLAPAKTVAFTGDISDTLGIGPTHNYNPTGLATASVLRITVSNVAGAAITGLVGGSDGRILIVINASTWTGFGEYNVGISCENGSSTDLNRIRRFSSDGFVVIPPGQATLLIYDSTLLRWTNIQWPSYHEDILGKGVDDHHNQVHDLFSADHPDVKLTTPPTDAQVLAWDAGILQWIPVDMGGGGGASVAVDEDSIEVVATVDTLDFQHGFDITNPVGATAQIDVDESELAHNSLGGIGADDHHAKSHAHSGADGSGTVAHSATTGQGTDDHHAKAHDHTGTDGSGILTKDEHDDYSEYAEIGDPSNPAANKLRLYAKDDTSLSALFYKREDGSVIGPLGVGGGGSGGDHNHTGTGDGGTISGGQVDTFAEFLKQAGNPSSPSANYLRLYAKLKGSLETLYYIRSDGVVVELGASTAIDDLFYTTAL